LIQIRYLPMLHAVRIHADRFEQLAKTEMHYGRLADAWRGVRVHT
jgi:hypothetical protein